MPLVHVKRICMFSHSHMHTVDHSAMPEWYWFSKGISTGSLTRGLGEVILDVLIAQDRCSLHDLIPGPSLEGLHFYNCPAKSYQWTGLRLSQTAQSCRIASNDVVWDSACDTKPGKLCTDITKQHQTRATASEPLPHPTLWLPVIPYQTLWQGHLVPPRQ